MKKKKIIQELLELLMGYLWGLLGPELLSSTGYIVWNIIVEKPIASFP